MTWRLDYFNMLYVGLPLGLIQKCWLVHNAVARLLMGADGRLHVTRLLKHLHWLSICYRARFKVFVLIYKALNNLHPGYFKV